MWGIMPSVLATKINHKPRWQVVRLLILQGPARGHHQCAPISCPLLLLSTSAITTLVQTSVIAHCMFLSYFIFHVTGRVITDLFSDPSRGLIPQSSSAHDWQALCHLARANLQPHLLVRFLFTAQLLRSFNFSHSPSSLRESCLRPLYLLGLEAVNPGSPQLTFCIIQIFA